MVSILHNRLYWISTFALCAGLFTASVRAQGEERVTPVFFQDPAPTTQPPTDPPPTAPAEDPDGDTPPMTATDMETPPPSSLRDLRRSIGRLNRGGTLGQYRSGYLADRLARAPNMFGDFYMSGGQAHLQVNRMNDGQPQVVSFDLPSAGGRRVKIAENNKSLPTDRVFLLYNHFHNATTLRVDGGPPPVDMSLDRYTLGFEKTFWDGDASVEVRIPFTGTYQFIGPGSSPLVEGGNFGDLSLIFKALLTRNETTSITAGLGLTTPTGSDLFIDQMPSALRLETDSTHLLPYFGVLHSPNDLTFFHLFTQLDIAANGDAATLITPMNTEIPLGKLNAQNLLFVDVGGGVWLHQDLDAPVITGVAATTEFHFATTMQDADLLTIPGVGSLGNTRNRQDFSNVTTGFHLQFGPLKSLHVGGVFPLRTGDDKGFDAEIQAAFNCRF